MISQFAMLASGSSGNSGFVRVGLQGVLIDIGLGPRMLASRLASLGLTWNHVHAVILTHTHGDHCKEATLAHLRQKKIPIFCHPDHHRRLSYWSDAYPGLRAAGLLCDYRVDAPFRPIPGLSCLAIPVSHDCDPTFAFRLDGANGLFGPAWSLGYLCDLGTWDQAIVEAVHAVDVLALEFNHDAEMERRSPRPRHLVERVLSNRGHLSNWQAAAFLAAWLRQATLPSLRHLVQLHLSRQCNRPALAVDAARQVLREYRVDSRIHTAAQQFASSLIPLDTAPSRPPRPTGPRGSDRRTRILPPRLPGLGPEENIEAR